MQLTVKLIEFLAIQTGQGKNGAWRKQEIIVETDGQIPKKIYVSLWGVNVSDANYHIGQYYKYDIDIESREYSGRWYSDVKAWRIDLVNSMNNNSGTGIPPSPMDMNDEDGSIIPF